MTSLELYQVEQLCCSNVNKIFQELEKFGLIDTNSRFYSASKEHAHHTCFRCLYPIFEHFKYENECCDFILKNTELFVYSYFLDEALDSTKVPSRVAQSTQIASLLLSKYYTWLCGAYDDKIITLFLNAYRENSRYLMLEKKWDFPELYLNKYGRLEKIHQKCILLLFPVYYLLDGIFETTELAILKKMYTNYYSYNLLVDDIRDFEYDIRNKCLTYPIIQYIKQTGKYPEKNRDLEILRSSLIKELFLLYQNVYAANHSSKKFSRIVDMNLTKPDESILGGECF
mgnify:CR=1 FL=1